MSCLPRLGSDMTDRPTDPPGFLFRFLWWPGSLRFGVGCSYWCYHFRTCRPTYQPNHPGTGSPLSVSVNRPTDLPPGCRSFVFLSFLDLVHQFKWQAPWCSRLMFRLPRWGPAWPDRPTDRPPLALVPLVFRSFLLLWSGQVLSASMLGVGRVRYHFRTCRPTDQPNHPGVGSLLCVSVNRPTDLPPSCCWFVFLLFLCGSGGSFIVALIRQ